MSGFAPVADLPIADLPTDTSFTDVTGTIQQTITFLTQAATGAVGAKGTISQTLTFLSQSAAGTVANLGPITQTIPFFSQSLAGHVSGTVVNFSFSALKNTALVDWGEASYVSYLDCVWFIPEEPLTRKQIPYVYAFLDTDGQEVTDNAGATVFANDGNEVIILNSCYLQTRFNWNRP